MGINSLDLRHEPSAAATPELEVISAFEQPAVADKLEAEIVTNPMGDALAFHL